MEKQNIFEFLVESSSEIILFFDAAGHILDANEMAKKQLEYGDLRDCCMEDIFPNEFGQCQKPLEDINFINGKAQNRMLYRGNRTCFPARVSFLRYQNGQEDSVTYICMAYDISNEAMLERVANRAGQEIEETEKLKSGFVANVTHELRTPVNGILGNTRELLSMETDKDKLKLLDLIERSCRDMNALINNILDFSKLNAGKFTLELQKFNFRSMMEYVEANHRNRMTEKGLEFTVSVTSGVPEYVVGDELRIVQILNNLISNAYKFTSVGAVNVEVVKTAQKEQRAELFFMVIDSGIGIAKAEQEKLFKSFSQVDASISRKYGGTGLGLNITKQLVELMNGDIHVQSERKKGTIFSFSIWVDIPEEDVEKSIETVTPYGGFSEQNLLDRLMSLTEATSTDKVWTFGERENQKEILKKLSKLVLSVEMENWEKAEGFAETVKKLLNGAPQELRSEVLRLKMSVQKNDYDKTMTLAENLRKLLQE